MIVDLVCLGVGFVVGVLFGRRNTKKVETALTAAKAEIEKLSGGKLKV